MDTSGGPRPSPRPTRTPAGAGHSDGDREPTWGYTRIQGALKNLGHCDRPLHDRAASCEPKVFRPGRQRPMTWRTFVQAHWPALVAADFFTTEVWTVRGLVTYYTAI